MKNLQIRFKLVILAIVPVLLLLITTAYSAYSVNNLRTKYKEFIYGVNEADLVLSESEQQSLRIEKHIYRLLFVEGEYDIDRPIIIENASLLKDSVKALKELIGNDTSTIAAYEKTITEFLGAVDTAVKLVDEGNIEEAKNLISTGYALSQQVTDHAESIDVYLEDANNAAREGINALQTQINIFLAVIFVVAVAVSISLSYRISRLIMYPIRMIIDAFSKVYAGDLNTNITYESKDELGTLSVELNKTIANWRNIISELRQTFNTMANGDLNIQLQQEYTGDFNEIKVNLEEFVKQINESLIHIQQASREVTAGSQQIASGAQILAQGATEQAGSIEELSASIFEISEKVKQNATNASDANAKAANIGQSLNASNNQMNEMIEAMRIINEKSDAISKIIKNIDNIAFQTNILALNAAVEAARAGTAGKGFAVVADEVRNLASKSAEAAKETNDLIKDTIISVQNGSKIAFETANSLGVVTTGSLDIISLINEINKASNEQATAISQITVGLDQINEVVQMNSATSEESAASAEELLGQAEVLNESISQFKLVEGF